MIEILLIVLLVPLVLQFLSVLVQPLELLDKIELPQRDWASFWWGMAGIVAGLLLLVRIFG